MTAAIMLLHQLVPAETGVHVDSAVFVAEPNTIIYAHHAWAISLQYLGVNISTNNITCLITYNNSESIFILIYISVVSFKRDAVPTCPNIYKRYQKEPRKSQRKQQALFDECLVPRKINFLHVSLTFLKFVILEITTI